METCLYGYMVNGPDDKHLHLEHSLIKINLLLYNKLRNFNKQTPLALLNKVDTFYLKNIADSAKQLTLF